MQHCAWDSTKQVKHKTKIQLLLKNIKSNHGNWTWNIWFRQITIWAAASVLILSKFQKQIVKIDRNDVYLTRNKTWNIRLKFSAEIGQWIMYGNHIVNLSNKFLVILYGIENYTRWFGRQNKLASTFSGDKLSFWNLSLEISLYFKIVTPIQSLVTS